MEIGSDFKTASELKMGMGSDCDVIQLTSKGSDLLWMIMGINLKIGRDLSKHGNLLEIFQKFRNIYYWRSKDASQFSKFWS